jgi:hypothetical protein
MLNENNTGLNSVDGGVDDTTSENTTDPEIAEFAYVISADRYIYRAGEKWCLDQLVNKNGIQAHLRTRGWGEGEIRRTLDSREHLIVHGFDIAPEEPEIYEDPADGLVYINTWVRPRLSPAEKPGEWKSIERVMKWLVRDDADGYRWLVNWIALKIQNPGILPKVATVFSTKPGAGKGTLERVIREMLGEQNCENISRENLESRFNTAWVGKLFVMADEVTSSGEDMKDIKETMKKYIDSARVTIEGKGKDARSVPNHAMWIIASNDRIAPVIVEPGDRRYTIFVNHNDAKDIRAFCQGFYESDQYTLKEGFEQEVRNFWRYLLDLKIDRKLVARPYDNDDRESMISASLPSQEAFINHVLAEGLEGLLERLRKTGELAQLEESEWKFGDDSYAVDTVYRCYREFCKQTGQHAIRLNKFGMAAANAWTKYRPISPKGKRVWAYRLTPDA